MAYTSGFTAVTGAVLTAAQWNTNVRDNFTAIFVGTTAGDIDYYASSTTKARLALVVGGFLYGGASAPAWLAKPSSGLGFLYQTNGNVPGYAAAATGYGIPRINSGATAGEIFTQAETVFAYRSSNLAFGTITETAVDMNNDAEDSNWHDTVTNPSRITPISSGRYIARACAVIFNNTATAIDSASFSIKTSTGAYLAQQSIIGLAAGGTYGFNLHSRKFDLTAGAYFQLVGDRSNNGSASVVLLASVTWLEVERVR